MDELKTRTNESVESDTLADIREPRMYRVLLHNDDYTAMEFVVDVLKSIFHKSQEEAVLIMLNVHKQGIGICGIYTFEVAETKVDMVHNLARANGFPLKCTMEDF